MKESITTTIESVAMSNSPPESMTVVHGHQFVSQVRAAQRWLFRQSAPARTIQALRQIADANRVTFQVQWDLRRNATICRCAVAFAAVTLPALSWWGSAQMIDCLSENRPLGALALGAGAFIGSLAIMGIIPVATSSLERISDNCTFEHVFGKFTRKMATFTQEQLCEPGLAEQAKQVRERAVWRMMGMAKGQPQLLRTCGMLAVTGATVAFKAPELLPLLIMFGLPSMIVELRHARQRSAMEEQLSPVWGALWGDLSNLMAMPALAMLHQFGAAMWFACRYRLGLHDASKSECRLEGDAALIRAASALLAGCGLALGICWLLNRTRSHELSVGEFMLITSSISGFAGCLSELASLIGQQWSQSKSINDLVDFLKHPATEAVSIRQIPLNKEYPVQPSAPSVEQEKEDTHISFDDVWLRYPSAAEGEHAVHNLSFSVKRGSIVVIVGPNGAGKSSSLAMMLRQIQPTAGQILINGKPVSEMSPEKFSEQIVMLPQQLRHFNLTLRELLNLGRTVNPASDQELWDELKRVGMVETVQKWKYRLDTLLGTDRREAVEPSGGQLQRLLLAAVVIANRGLIVLDEPVSMVDPEAARQFWNALFAERKAGRTVIFSTHHLGAVRRADKILFIEGGTLAAEGTHDELIETSAHYRSLFEAQAGDYQ